MSAETVHFTIRRCDVNQFLKSNTQQCFGSQSLSINNVNFQVYMYPNGRDKSNIGNIQLVINNTFEQKIKSVVVSCKLYCRSLQIMFKEVRILTSKDGSQFSKCDLPLFECQNIMIKNGINYLDFVCDIEILKIKYGTLPKQCSSSLSLIENTVKSHVHIDWVVSNKMMDLFKHSVSKKCFYSEDIQNTWCLCTYPNGTKGKKKDNGVELLLKLLRLPNNLKLIALNYEIYIEGKVLDHLDSDYCKSIKCELQRSLTETYRKRINETDEEYAFGGEFFYH
eukprot:297887_1